MASVSTAGTELAPVRSAWYVAAPSVVLVVSPCVVVVVPSSSDPPQVVTEVR